MEGTVQRPIDRLQDVLKQGSLAGDDVAAGLHAGEDRKAPGFATHIIAFEGDGAFEENLAVVIAEGAGGNLFQVSVDSP